MCAGKNAAGALLAQRGYAVVDADQTAHQALEDVKPAVIEAFAAPAREAGINLTRADGSLDRRQLGALLFAHPDLLARHESIIYPRINALLESFIDQHPDRPVVINAPLLHKSPILDRCDFVIFIDAWAVIRLFRAKTRDKLTFRHIYARFSAQKHLFAQYLSKSVDIERVRNGGSIRALARRLDTLLLRRGY
jgi:dephospho-CoA kinase